MNPVIVFFRRSMKPMSVVDWVHASGIYENVEGTCSHLLILAQIIAGARLITGALNLWPMATAYSWPKVSTITKSKEFEFEWTNCFIFLCDMVISDSCMPMRHFNWTDVTKFMRTKSITFLSETKRITNL